MRELSAVEISQVSGCGLVGDGAACIGGGVAAILGIATAETGVGAGIAWAGYLAAAGSCWEFGADIADATKTVKMSDVSGETYDTYSDVAASGSTTDYGLVWENSNDTFESYSYDYSFSYDYGDIGGC